MADLIPFSTPKKHLAKEARSESIADAIRTLLSVLSPEDQDRVMREVTQAIRPITTPRAGEVLGTIVEYLPAKGEFTVDEMKKKVAAEGVIFKPKEIYNALGYLARKGHVKRVGYARYVVDGVGIVGANLGGEPAPNED